MRMRVTVEFDEGVFCTEPREITGEVVLRNRDPKVKKDVLVEVIVKEAQGAAAMAAMKVVNFLSENPMVLKNPKTNEARPVKDVNEAMRLMSKGILVKI